VTPVRVLAGLVVAATAASWVLLDAWLRSGHLAIPLPWTAPVGVLMLTVVVLVAGWQVRRSVLGRRSRRLDPLVAARIVVLATAGGYVGAVLAGWYAAQALVLLPELVGDRRSRFLLAAATSAACLLLAGASALAQHWCRRPPDPDPAEP
jgi:hypothetical protein